MSSGRAPCGRRWFSCSRRTPLRGYADDRAVLHLLPATRARCRPSTVGLDFEDARFETADGIGLHSWFVPGPTEPTLLCFHGNAGNISHRVDQLELLHDAIEANILIVGYRGYGDSEGTPSERGFYADALAALSFLNDRDDVDDTIACVSNARAGIWR